MRRLAPRLRRQEPAVGAYPLDLLIWLALQNSMNPGSFLRRASQLAGTGLEVQVANFVEPIGEPLRQFFDKSRREASKDSISSSIAPSFHNPLIKSLRCAMFGSSPVTPSR